MNRLVETRKMRYVALLASGAATLSLQACGGGTGPFDLEQDGGASAIAPTEPRAVGVIPPATEKAGGGETTDPHCSGYDANKNVYWGDLHTHTVLSADAYGLGTRNFPHDAYRFASDSKAKLPIAPDSQPPGPHVSIDRPLDFSAITDHAEYLDASWGCGDAASNAPMNPSSPYYNTEACVNFRAAHGATASFAAAQKVLNEECAGGLEHDPACIGFTSSAWQVEIQAAHDAYQRCSFTTLVAYEWTRWSSAGATLHQNVIFGSENVPPAPFDSLDYTEPSELWSALDASCTADKGCSVLTIPHNANLSDGMAYELPVGVDAIRQMNKYQRLTEVHQTKGDSECYAGPESTDPTCNFEHLPGQEYKSGFVRSALALGLEDYAAQSAAGEKAVNPLQMGIVGGTDDHNGLPGSVKEDEWNGNSGTYNDTPKKRLTLSSYDNPGAITGVWAEENTREAIFAALERRETFATSGPRITLRFYQVWDDQDYCSASGAGGGFPANVIAAHGVPMGSTMTPPEAVPLIQGSAFKGARVPQFIVSATKDEADLAEVDIVKAAMVNGKLVEEVIRFTPSSPGTTWSAGSACVGFSDPRFQAAGPTFYYARVLQVPTWRWSHYDCAKAPSTPGCEPGGRLDVTIQERAWSSPIWWLP